MLAEENGYDEPDLDYKQGFVLYRNGQMELVGPQPRLNGPSDSRNGDEASHGGNIAVYSVLGTSYRDPTRPSHGGGEDYRIWDRGSALLCRS